MIWLKERGMRVRDAVKARFEALTTHQRVVALSTFLTRPTTRASLLAVASAAAILLLRLTPLDAAVRNNVENRFLFWARPAAESPGLDPRIKIFSFDDQAVGRLKALDVSLDDWGKMLAQLDERRPAMILIDKLFDRPSSAEEGARFAATLNALRTPVVADAFVTPDKIRFRDPLALDRPEFSYAELGAWRDAVPWLALTAPGHVYGPLATFAASFQRLGHAVYDSSSRIHPLMRVSEEHVVPHWAVYAAGRPRVDRDGTLYLGDRPVPLDAKGRMQVNVDRRDVYAKRGYSVIGLVEAGRRKLPVSVVDEGDFVVILPAMFTGNTDWRETPYGAMQGGYIMTALLQSVLTGKYLTLFDDATLPTLACGALALALGHFAPPALVAALLLVLIGAYLGGATLLFVKAGTIVPFILPLANAAVTATLVSAERFRAAQLERLRVTHALRTAQAVQESYIARPKFEGRGLRIEGFYQSAEECGGDFWGHFSPRHGIEYVIVADVTGHGVPAALVTAVSFSVMRMVAEMWERHSPSMRPSDVLAYANRVLCATHADKTTMTMFVLELDLTTGVATFANAGHNMPYFVQPKGREGVNQTKPFKVLAVPPSPVLGTATTSTFTDKSMPFLPGDQFVLFSDGLIENSNKAGEPWGKRRLQQTLAENAGAFEPLMAALVSAAADFVAEPRDDDTTVVVVEILQKTSLESAA